MAKRTKTEARHPKIFVLIPVGFVLIIGGLLLFGEWRQETTDAGMNDTVEEAIE
ncbi:nicotinate phosphoribosyltransferase [Histidinibacterium aquaticum]|uniref:Nicotinate phosphoribosyltransferase n=1 Tax=Histidinibacterium aquaticum TaxID=2613962 RepID=A0A5J5GFF3_9RHOB|nr:nicotinate phosphoribosyltransferase [Histidinibacterium aquaticum]KAA9006969.1 nicotinate phosphoribosyltransferase [Histidinibacterium aquaticum]